MYTGTQRVEKVFSPRMVQEYTVGPAGFRVLCPRKPGAFLETGSLHPPLAALHLFPRTIEIKYFQNFCKF